jgi:hypothetical protein
MSVSIKSIRKRKEDLSYSLCIRFTEKVVKELAQIAKRENVSVAEIIRKAVARDLTSYR